ncbi:hypothetical protein [Streptomyces sp. NPDC058084]|uniref:hypothetical protein n=1 Tax=Streptomyces sp. NPDC058084 TaxID=3346333 RepID=UPI0036EDAD92
MSGESGQKTISTTPESARLALADLYATRLKEREGEESGPVFRLKQVEADERPVLIQCCIR